MGLSELFGTEVLGAVGLVLDFVGAGLIIAVDFPRTRKMLAKVDLFGNYGEIIDGFEEAKYSGLSRNSNNFWPVLKYLLQYPGDLNYDRELLRPRTENWHTHLSRVSPFGNPTADIRDHPLYWAAVYAPDPKITYTDNKDRIIVKTGEGRGEFSRWHDTQRIQSELYNHFVRIGFLFLLGGFVLQLSAHFGFPLGG